MALAKQPLTDFAWRDAQRMLDLGRANRDRSSALAAAAYTDTRASQFVETWANLSAWASGAAPVQVSTGRLYGSTGGATAGINHALNLLPGQSCRIATTVFSNSSANVLIGIGSDTAGGTFTSGGTAMKGLAFHAVASGVRQIDNGTESALSNTTALVTGLYTVTIWIDANWYTIVAVSPDGTQEYRTRWARGSITPNNLSIYNGDAAALSGKYIGPISIVYGPPATASPRSVTTGTTVNPIEGNTRSVIWAQNPNASGWIRVALPKTYDSRVPVPWALMWHGSGSDETHWADNANGKVVANALLAAGIAVIGFSSSTTTPWGAQVELDAGYGAYTWARDNFNLGPGVFYANSMGSISALLALANRRVPGVMAYVGTSPTFDLANNYANASFTAAIDTAYGISGGNYAAQTAGHDPALMAGSVFRGVPLLVLAASDDVTVNPTANAAALVTKLGPYAPEALAKVDNTGGHSFDLTPFTVGTSAYDIVNFAKRHVGL